MPPVEERFGKYLLLEKIAEGGMGEVFLARQQGLAEVERLVVLKRIRPSLRHDQAFEELFLGEARITARLTHPNIVQLYEFGRIDGSFFLSFEHVRGANLARLRALHPGPWPVDVVFELASQVLSGLTHVHRLQDFDGRLLGIVHRDVTPPNVMISHEGSAKLLDFGVARGTSSPRDATGLIHGKVAYLSPEQCALEPLDGRSDLFSLGAVLHELLTGNHLFARPTEPETMGAVLFAPVPPPSERVAGIPRAVDELVLRALARKRDERYSSADEMLAEVDQAVSLLGLPRGPRLLARFMAIVERAPVPGPDAPPTAPPDTRPVAHNLLLVDDDDDNLQALRRTFRNRYRLFATTDPREAQRILETEAIHVIVTDLRMPHVSGLELLQHANRVRPEILKVITSALSDGPTLLQAINSCRIHRYIVKPWQPDDLRRTVEELLAEQSARSPRGPVPPPKKPSPPPTDFIDDPEDTIEHTSPTEPDPQPRSRLREALLAALAGAGAARVALVLVAIDPGDPALAARIATRLPTGPQDAVIPVSDEKIGLVLREEPGAPLEPRVARISQAAAELARLLHLPPFAVASVLLPTDFDDPDQALVEAATTLSTRRRDHSLSRK